MSDTTAFSNRLKKRAKHLGKWARRWPTTAYRVYDRDIPEFPWTIDIYGEDVYAQYFEPQDLDPSVAKAHQVDVHEVIQDILSPGEIVQKQRRRQKDTAQYEKQDDQRQMSIVYEDELAFMVNLYDYIDTGLFLDHRAMRRIVSRDVRERREGGRPVDVLNLFAYTCSFSVYAAKEGARTCSVDLSNTYLSWGKANFEVNGLSTQDHFFERDDILAWLPQAHKDRRRFDVIVLDPPTFSRSKSMTRDLDIQNDHKLLIKHCLRLLNPGGALYFSTNFRRFRLDESLFSLGKWEEITKRTISDDFRTPIHRAWQVLVP